MEDHHGGCSSVRGRSCWRGIGGLDGCVDGTSERDVKSAVY